MSTKQPFGESFSSPLKKGAKGLVRRPTPSRATITPEQIMKGSRVGSTTVAQSTSPSRAPVNARAGRARSRMRQRTGSSRPMDLFIYT